jgi:hypothetical protein
MHRLPRPAPDSLSVKLKFKSANSRFVSSILQLKLFACVLGLQHTRTQDIRPAQAG